MATAVTLSGGVSNPTSIGVTSTVVGSVLSNPTLVQTSGLDLTKVVSVNDASTGPITLGGGSGSGIVLTAPTAATVIGGTGNNELIASNDVKGTTITTGTGSGTVIGGAGGQLLGTAASGNGRFNIYGGSGDDTVIAAAGNNTITSGSGNNIVAAFGGTNAIVSSGTSDTIIAAGGNNTIALTGSGTVSAAAGNNVIFGGSTSSMFVGGSGNTTLLGGAGNDTIFAGSSSTGTLLASGGAGNDVIFAGKGTNALVGGDGRDLFVFSSVFGGGKSVIADFKAGTDTLAITGYSGITASSVLNSATASSAGVVITLSDKTTILLSGVTDKSTLNGSILVG
ncbi:calcium-binding protein [Azospirillum formosense]|uniref:calcium-binding protein n=1 Tax=Azospirillum formosense TaxID=861533 RepID=UPI00338F9DF0